MGSGAVELAGYVFDLGSSFITDAAFGVWGGLWGIGAWEFHG